MDGSSLLNILVLGNTLEAYAAVFLIILLTFMFAKIVFYIFKWYFQYYAKSNNTGVEHEIINAISGPLVWFFIVVGLQYATAILVIPSQIQTLIEHMAVLTRTTIVACFVLRIVDIFTAYYVDPLVKASESKLDDQLLPMFRKMIKVFIVFFAVMVALNNLGYNVTSLLAGLGIGGLAVALAAQETIGNVFGSVSIFADKVFEVGDVIKIGDLRGVVKEIGIRSTRIETMDGTVIAIPNAKIASERIENLSQVGTKKVMMTLGLTYNTSTKKLEKAIALLKHLLQGAAKHKEINNDFSVYFINFGAYTLDLQIIYWIPKVHYEEWTIIKHNLNLRIKDAFDKNKIEFAFPTQTLFVKK